MRIAQVAPLFESIPPRLYGGTERVVHYLTEALLREGHEVTLFGSGDSVTGARLVSACPESLRLARLYPYSLHYHTIQLGQLVERLDDFDLIHFHTDLHQYPLLPTLRIPNVTTFHGRLDDPHLAKIHEVFPDTDVVSISDSQREPLPWLNWAGTVYHGLPLDLYAPSLAPNGYLAFLGRISPEKRPDLAIEIAVRSGMKLKIAAKVDVHDQEYFDQVIRPLLHHKNVEFIGEINEQQKAAFLGGASALLFPIDWPEPFGLVMIESMACGTPVVAFRRGSVGEILEDGITGAIVETVGEAVDALGKVRALDRGVCRRRFEERFSDARMAADYVRIYESLTDGRPGRTAHPPHRNYGREAAWKKLSKSRISSTY